MDILQIITKVYMNLKPVINHMLINVQIKNNNIKILESNNIKMSSIKNKFSKKFILTNCIYYKNNIEQIFIDFDFVYFVIEITNKYDEKEVLYTFNLRIEDFIINQGNVQLLGIPIIDFDAKNYDQNVVDFFMKWENGEIISFLDLNTECKKSYNYSCLMWSGVPRKLNKTFYEINLELVKSNADFYNIVGNYFFGDRGYIGHDSYSFQDSFNNIIRNSEQKVTIALKKYLDIKFQDKLYIDKIIIKEYDNIKFEIKS
ncbi:hypothetical protein [Chryseobacterium contaminans]|uniref:hypothetical protein n=1 Tax=Chryseobacterium contaminans TaxID=1423959 RepID=UPI0030160127